MDATLIVVAVITAVPATLAAVGSLHNSRKIDATREQITKAADRSLEATQAVQSEVRTGNGATIGILQNAIETRRIEAIPLAERTTEELEHEP